MDRGRSGLNRSRSAQVKLKAFMAAYDERLDGSGQFGLRHPFEGYCPENCSGLMKPDTLLGENTRQIEVSDDQTTPYLFR